MNEHKTADDPADELTLYRNETTATFDSHLFEASEVEDASGDDRDGKSDAPVASLCSRTTSYGPFERLDLHDGDRRLLTLVDEKGGDSLDMSDILDESLDLCGACSDSLERRLREAAGGVHVESPPVDPTDCTVPELRDALDDDAHDWNSVALRGLLQAELDGDDRVTAVDEIEARLDEVDA